jgi:uncharacterized protein YutE (UPF0331/DUF86 family)
MPPLDRDLIRQRLADLTQHLDELEPLSAGSFDEYQMDYVKRHAVEKLIELIVESASDINRLIIEASNAAPPPTYFSTFDQMGKLNVLPKDLTARLASTTGLRNRLVHGYEKIEHKLVYRGIAPLVRDYRRYFVLIRDLVESSE